MRYTGPQADYPDDQQLLNLRFSPTQFRLLEQSSNPLNLTPAMQAYTDQLLDIGFSYSHEILVDMCIGKPAESPARMLVFINRAESAYAILTDLYHLKSWVYFTHYFMSGHRAITTCQPGALMLSQTAALAATADFSLQNTHSGALRAQSLDSQWKKHRHFISTEHPSEKSTLMEPDQHLAAEREAYRKYIDLLLNSVVLRQSDTQLVSFTHTGASSYHAAVTSSSAKRPKPKKHKPVSHEGKPALFDKLNYRNAALAASALVFCLLMYNVATYTDNSSPGDINDTISNNIAPTPTDEQSATLPPSVAVAVAVAPEVYDSEDIINRPLPDPTADDALLIAPGKSTSDLPEQYIVASEEDEMWRIAVENAEFYLMSNDGDPAPWIRTARKMAAGFTSDDPRLARTYFLAAMLERDPKVAEQQYNRALSIQTKTIGLYHTETAQTLEALAWVAEGARDDLEEAITHQRLALNVYRSIFGEEAEDTRAARWKLQYFEDRLEGRRPKSDDNRRLLPALARFAR